MKFLTNLSLLPLLFLAVSSQSFDCSDSQTYYFPKNDPDNIDQPSETESCDHAVRKALQCHPFSSGSFIRMAAQNSTKSNGTLDHDAMMNLIIERAGKTASFMGNMAFVMDKAETQRVEKIRSDPATMTRKMVASDHLSKINKDNFGAAIQSSDTLAMGTFTSFFDFGAIGGILGPIVSGIGSLFGAATPFVTAMKGGDSTEALDKINDQIKGLDDKFGDLKDQLRGVEDQIKALDQKQEAGKAEMEAELNKAKAAIEDEIQKQTAILDAEIKQQTAVIDADFKQEAAKIDQVLKVLADNFQNVQANFDKINKKLDTLALSIEKTGSFASYKVNQDRIQDVREKYIQFVSTPNTMTLNELHDTCKNNDPHLALKWIQRAVVYDQVGVQLISTILQDTEYDRNKLRQWAKIILQDAMNAMYLREVCVGVWHGQKKQNSSSESTAFNMLQAFVSIMKPDNATKILLTAANSLTHYNDSELYHSVCNSRKTSSQHFQDIVKTLDTVENDVVDNFGKVLKKDLADLLDEYSYIPLDIDEPYHAPLYDEAVRRLNEKYYWTKCWIGLSKTPITMRSGDGTHFAQASLRGKVLSALCAEHDATHPPVDKLTWPQMGQFWRSTGFQPGKVFEKVQHPNVFDGTFSNHDNLVVVTSNSSDFLYNTLDPFAQIRKMDGTFCTKAGKVLPYQQCDIKESNFVAYFASKTIPNSLGCKATHQELADQKLQRSQKCSLEAFRYVVRSFVWTQALKQFEAMKSMTGTPDSKYTSMVNGVYNNLVNHFGDFHWETYFVVGDSVDTCDVLETNCVAVPFAQATSGLPKSKIMAIWSPNCNMTGHVEKAKTGLDSMIQYSNALYGSMIARQTLNLTGDLRSAMLSYMIDPSTYIKSENLTLLDSMVDSKMSSVNFYSNNVLTVLPKGTAFYGMSDAKNYQSGAERLVTKRSIMSEKLQEMSDHSVIVSYYAHYEKPLTFDTVCA